MGVLRRDYLPADLEPLLGPAGFDGTIAVQARQAVEETGWLLQLADAHPFVPGHRRPNDDRRRPARGPRRPHRGRVDEVVRLAGRHHIDVQVSPLTGWMSGCFVLPPWARGDLFADPKMLAAERRLVGQIATRYRDDPAVQGFDFGNEFHGIEDPQRRLDGGETHLRLAPAEVGFFRSQPGPTAAGSR